MTRFISVPHCQRAATAATEDSVVSKMANFYFPLRHNFRNFNDFQTEHVVSHCITILPVAGLLLTTCSAFVSQGFLQLPSFHSSII